MNAGVLLISLWEATEKWLPYLKIKFGSHKSSTDSLEFRYLAFMTIEANWLYFHEITQWACRYVPHHPGNLCYLAWTLWTFITITFLHWPSYSKTFLYFVAVELYKLATHHLDYTVCKLVQIKWKLSWIQETWAWNRTLPFFWCCSTEP